MLFEGNFQNRHWMNQLILFPNLIKLGNVTIMIISYLKSEDGKRESAIYKGNESYFETFRNKNGMEAFTTNFPGFSTALYVVMNFIQDNNSMVDKLRNKS